MTDQPLVSIIINNCNYGRFLHEAIDSTLNQMYAFVEVIVVDDGSTDNSREIIAGYGERIIAVLKENGGQYSAFEAGFAASRGEIVCFLDSDDIFLSSKVDKVVEALGQHPNAGSCFHALKAVDVTGRELPLVGMILTGELDFRDGIRDGNMPLINTASSGLCFRRALLKRIFPLPEPIRLNGDFYFKWTALALTPTFYLDERLALQRIHGENWLTFTANDARRAKKIAREDIISSRWMQEQFPDALGKWAEKIFAVGLGNFWRSGAIEQDLHLYIREYMSAITPLTRLKVIFAAFCVRFGLEDYLRVILHAIRPSRYGSGGNYRFRSTSC